MTRDPISVSTIEDRPAVPMRTRVQKRAAYFQQRRLAR